MLEGVTAENPVIDDRLGPAGAEREVPQAGGDRCRRASPKLAYLVNQYPMTSHSFIRREIAALEAAGYSVDRFCIREGSEVLPDALDQSERARTRSVLAAGARPLVWSLLVALAGSPLAFLGALRLALRIGKHSERGRLVHLIYLAEAGLLVRWFQSRGIGHVHAHFGTNSATVAMLCRALGGPPFSFTVHGPEEFDSPRALALGEKISRAAFTVAISEYGRSQLYRWAAYSDWPRIHVVRCGVDHLFLEGEGPTRAAPMTRRLVSVGRLVPQKGQRLLIEAAARLAAGGTAFELTLVGDGPLRPEIEAMIRRHRLEGCVRLVGWQSNAAVRELILKSRALVLPSFAEGLPVVLMEALALGRPAISTSVAGIPELIRPGENGWLVAPSSVDQLAQAMREALEATEEQIAAMGRAGARRVRRDHDATQEAGRLARLIDLHASTRREPSPRNDLAGTPRPRSGPGQVRSSGAVG